MRVPTRVPLTHARAVPRVYQCAVGHAVGHACGLPPAGSAPPSNVYALNTGDNSSVLCALHAVDTVLVPPQLGTETLLELLHARADTREFAKLLAAAGWSPLGECIRQDVRGRTYVNHCVHDAQAYCHHAFA
jgi:hypothetical protein